MANRRNLDIVIRGDESDGVRSLGRVNDKAGVLSGGFGRLGAAAGVAFLGIAAGAALVVGGLFSIGATFDDAYDTIRVGTGATGAELAGLEQSFRDVFSSVPTDAGTAAEAISTINSRLGLTGDALEERASQLLELSRITETDLATNIETSTRVFGDWGIAVDDQAGALDAMFRASQATGAGVDQLGASVVQFGAPLRQLGFGFEESVALLGQFEAEGVNTELVMGSMRVALGRMARAGEDPITTFGRVTDGIKNAGSAGEANALALELFGARAGPDMAAAIREGRFSLGELYDTVANGSETIMGAAEDTQDFSEKWQIFTNRAMVALEPLATAIFDGLGQALEFVAPYLESFIGYIVELGSVFEEEGLDGVLDNIGERWSAAWPGIRDGLGTIAGNVGRWILDQGPVIAAQLVEWGAAFYEWVAEVTPPLLGELGTLVSDAGEWLLNTGLPLFWDHLVNDWAPAFWEWTKSVQGPLLRQLGALATRLGEWIVNDAAPMIAARLASWGMTFMLWVQRDVLPGLPGQLWNIAYAIATWSIEAGGWLVGAAGQVGLAVMRGIGNGIMSLGGWMLGQLAAYPGRMVGMFAGSAWWLFSAGVDLIAGLWRGIESLWGSLVSWVSDRAGDLVSAITSPLDIFSPSRVMFGVGENIMLGLAGGMADGFESAVIPTATGSSSRLAELLTPDVRDVEAAGVSTGSRYSTAAGRSSSSSSSRGTLRPLLVRLTLANGRVIAEELVDPNRVLDEEQYGAPDI